MNKLHLALSSALIVSLLAACAGGGPIGDPKPDPPTGRVIAIAAGNYHALALMEDGSVAAWGSNSSGALGLGQGQSASGPTTIPGLSGVASLAAGATHSLAATDGGSVYAWGNAQDGAVGTAAAEDVFTPRKLDLENVASVAAGASFSLALTTDGKLYAWGANQFGQLGVGSTDATHEPTLVTGLPELAMVAAGEQQVAALGRDGSVWTWGSGSAFGLGNDSTENVLAPQELVGLRDQEVVQVTAGAAFMLARHEDGQVSVWGVNHQRQLALATGNTVRTPRVNDDLAGFSSLSAGGTSAGGLNEFGVLHMWGSNLGGKLGERDEGVVSRHSPEEVPGLTQVSQMEQADAIGVHYTLALTSSGVVYAWGASTYLGIDSATPVVVIGPN